jgi:hypothetical protein
MLGATPAVAVAPVVTPNRGEDAPESEDRMWRRFIAEIAIPVAVVRGVALPMTHDRVGHRFLARSWHRVSVDWRGRTTVAVGLAVWMVTGWLLVAGAVGLTQPTLAASTPPAISVAVVGWTARIYQPGIPEWPIPVDRRAYDAYYLGFDEDDDGADGLFTTFEWIKVKHHQHVRIIESDGEAHHIELLEGPNVGRRGWVKTRHLAR